MAATLESELARHGFRHVSSDIYGKRIVQDANGITFGPFSASQAWDWLREREVNRVEANYDRT